MWPFNRREHRTLSDAERVLLAQAMPDAVAGSVTPGQPDSSQPLGLGAVEAAASLTGRAFSLARVVVDGGGSAAEAALTPSLLELIGRELVRRGEAALAIRVDRQGLRLAPSANWTVEGEGADPASWLYRLTLNGPTGTREAVLRAEAVVHVRVNIDPREPWRGRSGLDLGFLTSGLSATLEGRLAEELTGPVGQVVMLPAGTPDQKRTAGTELSERFNQMRGKLAYRSLQGADTGLYNDQGRTPNRTWAGATRIGANPPESLAELRAQSFAHTLAALGVPPELFTAQAQGTTAREAQRRWIATTLDALGTVAAAELSEKLEAPITLNFDRLAKTDLAARARAYKQLTEAGIAADEAKRLTGLD